MCYISHSQSQQCSSPLKKTITPILDLHSNYNKQEKMIYFFGQKTTQAVGYNLLMLPSHVESVRADV